MRKIKLIALLLLLASVTVLDTGCSSRRGSHKGGGCNCPGGF